jgi:peptidoglycan/xylan/chitin deacetylase (PgdA/CDA1 family)
MLSEIPNPKYKMILPPIINKAYLFSRKYYLDVFGRLATPQYGVHIFNGHYIDVKNETSTDIFYDTLNQLSKEVDFVSFQEGSELVHTKQIPTNQKLMCLSFDDGYEECFTKIKPVLDAFNIKAAFFICPNYVEGTPQYIDSFLKNNVFLSTRKLPMSWEQIQKLHAEGHLIGSHTMNHINCRETPIGLLDIELRDSKRILEEKLQTPCEHFAYTYGKIEHFSEAALACAEQYYTYIYSQAGHRDYFSFDGRVLNRRHFEGTWSKHHVAYYCRKNRPS